MTLLLRGLSDAKNPRSPSPATQKRFADAVCGLFEDDANWSVMDLDGAAEFFEMTGYVASPEAEQREG